VATADLPILREIVRVIQAQGSVPERVQIQAREFEITYLEDHRQRIEEAIRRHDGDRLNILFGQLSSKVKYRQLRRAARVGRGRPQQRAAKEPKGRSTKTPRTSRATRTGRAKGTAKGTKGAKGARAR